MIETVRSFLREVQISSEELAKWEEILCREDSFEKAEAINEALYQSEDADRRRTLLFAKEEEEKGLIFSLAYLMRVAGAREYFREKGIDLRHVRDLLEIWRDVSLRSHKKFGFYGLNGVYRSFLYSYMKPARYNVGRLNFEIGELEEDYEVYQTSAGICHVRSGEEKPEGKCILKRGDPVLHVHVPPTGPLTMDLVQESFQLAKEFFAEFFPDHAYRAFVCSSWLLDENLKKVLKPTSNILAFQDLFTVAATADNTFSLYWHIFDMEDFLPPETLVPANDFQKRILDYVLAGNKLLSGKGYILV